MSGLVVINVVEKAKVMTMMSRTIIRNVTTVGSHDSELIIDIVRRSAEPKGTLE